MLQNGSLILASSLLIGGDFLCPAADAYSDMLGQFLRYEPDAFGEVLDSRRPLPVAPELAASIVAALPKGGEMKRLTVSDIRKLESLSAVLRAHGREQVYRIKVVDSRQARVGLHARFVLLVTHTVLRILSTTQLQAIVAHEIGHEYVWDEYEAARQKSNRSRLRALELFCDGVATVTLSGIGAAPESLTDALRLLDASDRRNGFLSDDNSYPTVAERADFARQIVRWLDGGRGSSSHRPAAAASQQKIGPN
jgi:hypothetical protein